MQPMMVSSIRKLHTTDLCLRPLIDENLIIWEEGLIQEQIEMFEHKNQVQSGPTVLK